MAKFTLISALVFLIMGIVYTLYTAYNNIPYFMYVPVSGLFILSAVFLRVWKKDKPVPQGQGKAKKEQKNPKERNDDEIIFLDEVEEPEEIKTVDLKEEPKKEKEEPKVEHCWKCGLAEPDWYTWHDQKNCEHEGMGKIKLSVPSEMKELIDKLEEGL